MLARSRERKDKKKKCAIILSGKGLKEGKEKMEKSIYGAGSSFNRSVLKILKRFPIKKLTRKYYSAWVCMVGVEVRKRERGEKNKIINCNTEK